VMVTEVPNGPAVGLRLMMFGTIVNGRPLLGVPLTVTTKLPVVAEVGTIATIEVSLQLVAPA